MPELINLFGCQMCRAYKGVILFIMSHIEPIIIYVVFNNQIIILRILGERGSMERDKPADLDSIWTVFQNPSPCLLHRFHALSRQTQNKGCLTTNTQRATPSNNVRVLFNIRLFSNVIFDFIGCAFYSDKDFNQPSISHLLKIIITTLIIDNVTS